MLQTNPSQPRLSYPRLATIIASRIALNAIFRLAYPLVPFAVIYFGVSIREAAWLVTVQVLTGLTSPIGGWLGDHYGHRRIMALGLAVVFVGVGGAALAESFGALVAALTVAGLGTATYQPAMLAYVSNLTPYRRRGRALGAVELSWSLAGIFAVPPLVALAEWSGDLRLPYAALAGLILLALSLSLLVLPSEAAPAASRRVERGPLRRILLRPELVALLLFLWLAVCGQEVLFIAQPPWLVTAFGATPRQVGDALRVFGIGELVGVALAAALTDRIGVLRAPLLGFAGAILIYLLLPPLATTWTRYLLLFGVFGLLFEFAIVSSFSLASTINPAARGIVMAATATAMQTGRAAGSRIGVGLLESSSLIVNGIVAAVLTSISVIVAAIGVRPQENDYNSTESEPVRNL